MTRHSHLHLNAFLMGVGHHEAAWRHRTVDPERLLEVSHFQELARIAERGKFDSVFLADVLSVGPNVVRNTPSVFEPTTLLSAVAAVTEHIGLIATASTTYHEPFHLARVFASLDHISGGRAGWNIVTSAGEDEAANFGADSRLRHADRYRRAEEFVEVALGLWESWDESALRLDTAEGVFTEPGAVHALDHHGEHFDVAGPLNTPRSPQGKPVLVQAGSSESGKEFAARYAEAVFTAQQTLEDGVNFYTDLKSRLGRYGRDPAEVKVLPGVVPFLADTEAEARELEREFTDLISPDYALRQLERVTGRDFSGHDLDEPVPELAPVAGIEGAKSRYELIRRLADSERLTLRELLARLGGGRGHRTFTGTPAGLADDLQRWFEAGAADGFNIMAPYLPGGLEIVVDEVVPILQERGLFRTDYDSGTLSGHLGLDRRSEPTIRTDHLEKAI